MSTHTPGPWKLFDGWGANVHRPIIIDSIPDVDGKCVANCIAYIATNNDQCKSNATLIAAAPELLDCLRDCVDMIAAFNCYGPERTRAEELLKRIEGE